MGEKKHNGNQRTFKTVELWRRVKTRLLRMPFPRELNGNESRVLPGLERKFKSLDKAFKKLRDDMHRSGQAGHCCSSAAASIDATDKCCSPSVS